VRILSAALLLLAAPSPVGAETGATPGLDDPRLQTLVEQPGEPGRLVAFPEASLTLIMRKGERVQRVALSDSSAFRVVITGDNDSLSITPLRPGGVATMQVDTGDQLHQFNLETGRGLAAAYVVRLVASPEELAQGAGPVERRDLSVMTGRYRLTGDRTLRPQRIADDGAKTFIEWGTEQSLPAVLGIGPTGEEEIVAGYMRNGLFTIDRVYPQLVFRIDRHRTIATREIDGTRP
jgi:type IV secretion system protein VirB9